MVYRKGLPASECWNLNLPVGTALLGHGQELAPPAYTEPHHQNQKSFLTNQQTLSFNFTWQHFQCLHLVCVAGSLLLYGNFIYSSLSSTLQITSLFCFNPRGLEKTLGPRIVGTYGCWFNSRFLLWDYSCYSCSNM